MLRFSDFTYIRRSLPDRAPSESGNQRSAKLAKQQASMVSQTLICILPERSLKFSPTGVAVLAVIRSKTNAFPVSTVVIEQYRPPIGRYIIGMEIGLIDRLTYTNFHHTRVTRRSISSFVLSIPKLNHPRFDRRRRNSTASRSARAS